MLATAYQRRRLRCTILSPECGDRQCAAATDYVEASDDAFDWGQRRRTLHSAGSGVASNPTTEKMTYTKGLVKLPGRVGPGIARVQIFADFCLITTSLECSSAMARGHNRALWDSQRHE